MIKSPIGKIPLGIVSTLPKGTLLRQSIFSYNYRLVLYGEAKSPLFRIFELV